MFHNFRYPSHWCVTPDVFCMHILPYLRFVSHGPLAQHGDLSPSLLLQTLDCVALRSQNLSHEIELMARQRGATLA